MTGTARPRVVNQVIRPEGEIDLATAPETFDTSRVRSESTQVTARLDRVTYLDAAGLGALVTLRNGLIASGRELQIVDVQPRQARVFRLGGLQVLLEDPVIGTHEYREHR
jgi:anti-anti-sigma factor